MSNETTGAALVPAQTEEVSGLVRLAIEQKVPVEVLERLVALQERVTARDAEQALAEALNAFQAECPPIPRVGKAVVLKNGVKQYEYRFAPYDKTLEVIRPYLNAHGLSFTHDSAMVNGEVEVVCRLQHIMGAGRQSTFRAPVDNSGGKNPLQGVGSARSYGKRYTLVDVLGLSTEEDDDGRAAGGGGGGRKAATITEAQEADLRALMQEVGADEERFREYLGVGFLKEIQATALPGAIQALEARRAQKAKKGGDA